MPPSVALDSILTCLACLSLAIGSRVLLTAASAQHNTRWLITRKAATGMCLLLLLAVISGLPLRWRLSADAAITSTAAGMLIRWTRRHWRQTRQNIHTMALEMHDTLLDDPALGVADAILANMQATAVTQVIRVSFLPRYAWITGIYTGERSVRVFAGFRLWRHPSRGSLPHPRHLLAEPRHRWQWREIAEHDRDWDAGFRKLKTRL